MCGVAGIVNFSNERLNRNLVRSMIHVMRHRGPDGEGDRRGGRRRRHPQGEPNRDNGGHRGLAGRSGGASG